jgi:rhodanese-related sulfurtransferase
MNATRVFLRVLPRTSQNFRQYARLSKWQPQEVSRASIAQRGFSIEQQSLGPIASVRWHSAPPSQTKVYTFEDVRKLVEDPSDKTMLIDVREPVEYQAGFIPTAINIPITSQPDALFLSPEDFESRFGFPKPAVGKEIVFYCKAGVRSSAAAAMAKQHGYQHVGEYRGSWLDWEKNGGASSGHPEGKGTPHDSPA